MQLDGINYEAQVQWTSMHGAMVTDLISPAC